MDILLGIILFFIILYYAFKLFLRYGLPWILSRFMRSQQEKFNRQYQDNAQTEGEIKINKSRSGKKKDDTGFGEYVDYEDVDEH